MGLNELLLVLPSLGVLLGCILLWRNDRDWATRGMLFSQIILALNVLLISAYLPKLNNVSMELFGNPLVIQRAWYYVARTATAVFAITFICFAVRYRALRNAS